jgi:hypothetical protein
VVLAYKMSRLGRSVAEIATLVQLAVDNDIRVISVTEGTDTSTPTGRMVVNILASVAQVENEQRGEFIADTKARMREAGKWCGGRVPYGYVRANGIMKPLQAEARVIKRAFTLYASGQHLVAISEQLLQPRWRVQSWLRNDAYGGNAIFPALVDAKTFALVAALHDRHSTSKATGAYAEHSLLTGLAYCGMCGHRLTIETASVTRGSKAYRYYRYICSGYKSTRNCRSIQPRINTAKLEARVISAVRQQLKSPRALAIRRKAAAADKHSTANHDELQRLLRANADAASRLVAIIASDAYNSYSGNIQRELDALAGERVELERQLGLRATPELDAKTFDGIVGRVATWSDLGHSEQRQLLCLLIARVEWDGERISVAYR